MARTDSRPRPPRRIRPALEGLETRALLSTASANLVDSPVIPQFANLLYGPSSASPMTPTPRELKRQSFAAAWIGQYTVGPPRFSDRASTIHAYAVSGGSNQFLKGKLNMVLFPPADPAATPTPGDPYANQVTGIAGLFPEDILQSGTTLVLDLNATPGAGSNPLALPTKLTWTYDNNTSAGAYAAPEEFIQGAGTLTIKWMPDPRPLAGTSGSGKMIVIFKGLINDSQVVNPIAKDIS